MILLWGVSSDGPLAAVQAALARRGAPVFHLDQRRAAETVLDLRYDETGVSGELTIGADRCTLADVTGVYVRAYDTRALLDADADVALHEHAQNLEGAVQAFLDVTPAKLINPAAAMASNSSKPYQAALIARHGFLTPPTLVTTDPAAAVAFQARHEAVIYKSVSGVRSIVSRLTDDHLDRLDDIAWCPTQFQAQVPGRDFRVHVVGERLFTCEIATEADDYRYAHRQDLAVSITEGHLPEEVAERCRRLAADLGLAFAGVDLRRTPQDEWCCFEVNPSPAFTYYEDLTGLPIAEAVADLLIAQAEERAAASRATKPTAARGQAVGA
ncbi:ATP-grasp domain-containing protein [Caulobacter endophyticus]|uniref:RimK domain-containing protein ATP-grasp n=1 Tax=Caulobacter endophyticus TaxID=2172652 RepID=A0A2T9JES9_9CAUL|nr:RimK domain-containing protein ATP-grasp [Caulobacter endophyticus]PVM82169.1 RimK domain-containing protein ATP-grasp [Caulobacter endophyticus]